MLSWPRTYKNYDRSEYTHRFGLMGKTGSTTYPFRGISYDRVCRTVLDTEWRGHAPQVALDLRLGTLYLELEHKRLQWNEEIFGQVRSGVLYACGSKLAWQRLLSECRPLNFSLGRVPLPRGFLHASVSS